MAVSARHRGWLLSHRPGILAGVYDGALGGAVAHGANTALDGVLVGTPVTPALAVDSLVLSNTVQSGDVLIAANNGGNSQAWIWIDASAAIMALYASGVEQLRTAVGAMVINEGSADIDFRVETDGIQYAIYSDGGKNALVLGSNTDTSSADQLITVSRAARTATANTSYYDMRMAAAGAVTVPTGTTAVVATLSLAEPNITATGTVTRAATLHISNQPTEGGTANAAIFFGAAANIACTTSLAFNDDSEDIDFRFETNGMAYAIYSDGGKDALVLGSNTDTSSADQLITVSRAARTATANTNYYDLAIQPAGAVTVPTGTTAIVASLMVAEPNITATGTVTAAATVYISGAPTEGGSNYALWVDSGDARFDGDLTFEGSTAFNVAAGQQIGLGALNNVYYYLIGTRLTTSGAINHAFDTEDWTLASGATVVGTLMQLSDHTFTYTGTTQVTSAVNTMSILARTIAGDTATLTVDQANSLRIVAPVEGSNVTLTAASAIRIADTTGTPTNQYGIFIETLTAGATADYAIWVAGANAVHLGTAGTATGLLEIDGATSGTVKLTVAAAAGTWTMTLPADDGTNGDQLTVASGDGVCTWAGAASQRELKDIVGQHDAQDALDKMLATKVYDFHYKPGMGTGDKETEYVGVVADEAPWAMHYRNSKVNPINSLGYTVLAFQAMAEKIAALESKLAALGA